MLILVYPIAFEINLGLRLLDFVIIFMIFVGFFKNITLSHFSLYFLILVVLLVTFNVIGGHLIGYSLTPDGFNLTAKLFLHFLAFIVIKEALRNLKDRQLNYIATLLLLVTTIMSAWCIYQISQEPLERVGFPFSNAPRPDSHVLGSVLSLLFIFFLLLLKFKSGPEKLFFALCLGVILIAIFATGSRSIVLILGLYFLATIIRQCLQLNIILVVVLVASISFLVLFYVFDILDTSNIQLRSIQFSLEYASEAKRIARLFEVMEKLEGSYYIFGRGLFTAETYYFDGTITFLFYNFGMLGVVAYFIVMSYHFKNYILFGSRHSLFAFLSVVSVVVTEFFLLSRWFIPVLIGYFVLYEIMTRSKKLQKATLDQVKLN